MHQFKITLLDIKPPIWRRIQVPDVTLDDLHFYIQRAMGWTNSHLHQFEIGGKRYGDPELLDDGWGDDDFIDSTEIHLSNFLKKKRRPFRFFYEYDFGDGWRHEVVYESSPESQSDKEELPRCIDGARACPPEDVGGPWGYEDFLAAMKNPKHPRHAEFKEWFGGRFDPEEFAPEETTECMRQDAFE